MKDPYVAHGKVQVQIFNMILISSPDPVPSRDHKIVRSCKGSYSEKAKIVNRGSLCSARESTGSKLQCDPYHISVACS